MAIYHGRIRKISPKKQIQSFDFCKKTHVLCAAHGFPQSTERSSKSDPICFVFRETPLQGGPRHHLLSGVMGPL